MRVDLFGRPLADFDLMDDLRASVRNAIAGAKRRQAERITEGKPPVEVSITLSEAMQLLAQQNYCCAISGEPFFDDSSGTSFGPARPSFDRIERAGPYSVGNIRVVLLGVNALRGCGTDEDMLRIARAIVERNPS